MINQKSYASLRAAWVQAEHLSLPESTGRNAGSSLGARLHRLQNALLQQFLFYFECRMFLQERGKNQREKDQYPF